MHVKEAGKVRGGPAGRRRRRRRRTWSPIGASAPLTTTSHSPLSPPYFAARCLSVLCVRSVGPCAALRLPSPHFPLHGPRRTVTGTYTPLSFLFFLVAPQLPVYDAVGQLDHHAPTPYATCKGSQVELAELRAIRPASSLRPSWAFGGSDPGLSYTGHCAIDQRGCIQDRGDWTARDAGYRRLDEREVAGGALGLAPESGRDHKVARDR